MSHLVSDVSSAFKALAAARGFTAVAVLTLGIGLALCVTVLTVVNAYVLRGLPYPASDRSVSGRLRSSQSESATRARTARLAALDDVIESPIAWDLDVFYMLGNEYPESMPGGWVTPGYMQGLGRSRSARRMFTAR